MFLACGEMFAVARDVVSFVLVDRCFPLPLLSSVPVMYHVSCIISCTCNLCQLSLEGWFYSTFGLHLLLVREVSGLEVGGLVLLA